MDSKLTPSLIEKLQQINTENQSFYYKTKAAFTLLDVFLEALLEEDQIHFTTLFSKLAYVSLKYKLSGKLSYCLHQHRKDVEQLTEDNANEEKYNTAKYAICELIIFLHSDIEIPKLNYSEPKFKERVKHQYKDKIPFARVTVFSMNEKTFSLEGFNEEYPEDKINIKLNISGRNDDYNSILRFLKQSNRFPVTLHLEFIDIDEENNYIPSNIIFEPDYLVDITTIAECFKPGESSPLFYFIKKFFPVYQNKYLIIGNIANFFLDELFNNPQIKFQDLIKKTFKISPLGFAAMSDMELREVVGTLKKHFYSIQKAIQSQFPVHHINKENTFLEPSFYAPKYGIQGRLDLIAIRPREKEAKIIELKSGKPFKVNKYGLNINHYVQTLLYDLMVNSVTDYRLKVSSFILYSSQDQDTLRFAPPLNIQQKEALKLRNQIVEIDFLLADLKVENDTIFSFIKKDFIRSEGFAKRDIDLFEKSYHSATTISRKYFNAFSGFIAREQILAKTGEFGLDKSNGLAGLWLDDMTEKVENFRVLNALKITSITEQSDYTEIVFERTAGTERNANFRKGDLGVLYPYTRGNLSVVKNQIFKCSIIELSWQEVKVRLRNKQNNTGIFERNIDWHIEHDHLDHGFNHMYQNLFSFINSDRNFQELLLGRKAPEKAVELKNYTFDEGILTKEQESTLHSMINSNDYFLLWGPPGTGKTSVILHSYVKAIYENTSETLLVMAYTNRAVDEICEAVVRIGGRIKEHFLRIGSRYSSDEAFHDDLLVSKLDEIEDRKSLQILLGKTRIVVSTLASILGKKDLFSLIKFDTIVIDEASQILEPQLCGILAEAKKFILIGDHNQLPAIVLQNDEESKVEDEQLIALGLTDRRNSLFERLYRRCFDRKWDWAIGNLSHQGRMHHEIMDFANSHFYNGLLHTINGLDRLISKKLWSGYVPPITENRLIYIPAVVDNSSINFKTNADEAAKVVKVLEMFKKIYSNENKKILPHSIGIITPYRAQISAIASAISTQNLEDIPLTIDTVERYQGGARDIIIISLCLNLESQLKQLVNLSSSGVDRKLNVAMTRAREQIIVLGNPYIMKKNYVYASLIDHCAEWKL